MHEIIETYGEAIIGIICACSVIALLGVMMIAYKDAVVTIINSILGG